MKRTDISHPDYYPDPLHKLGGISDEDEVLDINVKFFIGVALILGLFWILT